MHEMIYQVINYLIRLYEFYASKDSVIVEVHSASEISKLEIGDDPHALIACQFSSYLEEEYSSVCKIEVDKYLGDYCEGAKDVKFDILASWKANSSKYPALSQLARDVLAIPISTIASESAFSMGGRIFDTFRSSLSPIMVEVLICAQNWLRSSLPISFWKAMDSVEEFQKQCETENQVDLKAPPNVNLTVG
ncbi:AC9 transposase [Actinidia chinensis var. chinensis]|uniref:AC9 transposase n=1 Tax=Actinidia chinensis var. chinensis TaxID=1590841 RepID=A0A2R6R949_ACTCC|nr:AC9 transposase [Actinidia chinensis var. chinensis]